MQVWAPHSCAVAAAASVPALQQQLQMLLLIAATPHIVGAATTPERFPCNTILEIVLLLPLIQFLLLLLHCHCSQSSIRCRFSCALSPTKALSCSNRCMHKQNECCHYFCCCCCWCRFCSNSARQFVPSPASGTAGATTFGLCCPAAAAGSGAILVYAAASVLL